jgi:hypothetical protein
MRTPTTSQNTWTRFHFESNRFFDTIAEPADWLRLRSAYPDMSDEELLAAKQATYKGTLSQEQRDSRPNFGFRLEHDGGKTLADFFAEHQMTLS